ncbi:MAG: starch-binding protein [Clostridiales bacterium]|nr:starch-binding protein [Clostridiales bacterium]
MKRRLQIFIMIMVMVLTGTFAFGCGKTNPIDPTTPDDNSGGQNSPGQWTVYLKVTGNDEMVVPMQKSGSAESYSATVTLAVGDMVSVYDSNGVTYNTYNPATFTGTAAVAGEYTFEFYLIGASGVVNVTAPQSAPSPSPTPEPSPDPTPTPTPDPTPTPTPTPTPPPDNTKVNVYYTNNESWSSVYAYVWNSATSKAKAVWPGTKLSSFGTSGFGEQQFKVEVDYSQYDRIIFNDGGNKQTKDLIVGRATSGYYGRDGIFTMNTSNYGNVTYTTLKDTKNLSYLTGAKPQNNNFAGVATKKISVYTPPGYSSSKRYGVLYMFDGQNLYTDGSSSQPADKPWAVDVAVTSLMKNGGDGVIIVAIDNTDGYRDQELTMSMSFGAQTNLGSEQYGDFKNGKLDNLGNFIKETLMPWVKSHYSVDDSREKTGIAGSSSGGLAAYYVGLRDNDLYGYIGAFSPANGIFVSSAWTNFYSRKSGFTAGKPKVYVYCGYGDHDLEDMLVTETKKIKSGLTAVGFAASSVVENYVEGGRHSEEYWRIAFTDFLGKMAP